MHRNTLSIHFHCPQKIVKVVELVTAQPSSFGDQCRAIVPISWKRLRQWSCTVQVLVLAALTLGCAKGTGPANEERREDQTLDGLTSVTLLLNWFPEAEHGGFYAAKLHGFYEQAGLEVTVKAGGPGVPVVQNLDTGQVDFAVTNADRVIFGRAAGADIVALMAPMQNSPRCILLHREAGITHFDELSDVTLAVGSGPAFYKYMALKLPLTNVETVAYPGSIGPFLANKRFAQQAYVFSEPFVAREQGADPVTLMVSDLGYNPYASVLVARGKTIQDKAELVRKMVQSSIQGWNKYLKEPAVTNAHIRKLNPDMTEGVLRYGAEQIAKLSLPAEDSTPMGHMTPQRWQQLIDQLGEIGLVEPNELPSQDTFTTRFISEDGVHTN